MFTDQLATVWLALRCVRRRDVALGSTQGATSLDWNSLGEVNELENSEDRRSVGRHGNQHVRLRCAQVDTSKATLPGSCGDARYRAAAGVPSLLQTIVAIVFRKSGLAFCRFVWPTWRIKACG